MKKGSITIYLCIILVGVILLVSVVSESARVSMVQSQSKAFTYMAADSIMAQYAKQIYEDYGILLVWEKESVKEQMSKYIQANINMADLNVEGSNLMGTNLLSIDIQEIEYVTENGGKKLVEQIGSYVKYSELLETADNLTEWFNTYKEGSEAYKSDTSDVAYIVDKTSEELQEYVGKIEKIILKIKDTDKLQGKLNAVSQKMEKINEDILAGKKAKNVSQFLKEYMKLITEFDKKADDVDSAISLIGQYDEKKEQFFEDNGYTSGERDYIEDNLSILENIRDEIIEVQKLDVSKYSDIDSKNLFNVLKALEKAKSVEDEMESLQTNKVTEEDKKNQSIYESAKTFLKEGFLSLVVEDVSKISNASISDSNLPTKLMNGHSNKTILQKTKDKAVLSVYSEDKFGNYVSLKENTSLKYELEYIINGECSDKDNLIGTVEKLVVMRSLINASYLITDSTKMTEISTIALSAATAIGLPFMESIIKVVLIEAWSLAEAVNDVKTLLAKGKVSLIKTKNNWQTSLNNLLSTEKPNSKKGLNYVQYCQLLIMLQDGKESLYRIMDTIQVNVQKRYNKDFRMSECFESVKMSANFETKQLFTSMPWMLGLLSNAGEAYKYTIDCSDGY